MPRFLVSHNIPSPYRLHLFRALRRKLDAKGWDFEVAFMASEHAGRPASWRPNGDLGFNHSVYRDVGWRVVRGDSHFNPSLIRSILERKPDILMLGGVWDNPTNALLASMKPAGLLVGWFEGNTMHLGSKSRMLALFKRTLLLQCHAWALPGIEGKKFARYIAGSWARPMLTLPNIVDESSFVATGDQRIAEGRSWLASIGANPEQRIIVIPARLMQIKGLVPFLDAFAETAPSGWQVVIIGEGELESQIRARIEESDLAGRAFLSKFVAYSMMPSIYAASSVFCLPSFQDANPLSVVEAMHAGRPILLSRKAGNYPEAVNEGVNGFGFDPNYPNEIREAARKIMTWDEDSRLAAGAASKRIAGNFWSTDLSIERFVDDCINLHASS